MSTRVSGLMELSVEAGGKRQEEARLLGPSTDKAGENLTSSISGHAGRLLCHNFASKRSIIWSREPRATRRSSAKWPMATRTNHTVGLATNLCSCLDILGLGSVIVTKARVIRTISKRPFMGSHMETGNEIAPVYLLRVRGCFVRLTAGRRGADCKSYAR